MAIEFLKAMTELLERGEDVVVVRLLKTIGSAPQEVGAQMIVTRQGLHLGTIGGGKVEAQALLLAQKMINQPIRCDLVEWNLQKDIGMTCGGVVSLSFEKISSPQNLNQKWNIAIFGAGHVAQELIPLLLKLDCFVYWIDSRSEWLEKIASSNKLKKIHTAELSLAVKEIPEDSFVASMTMGHSHDLPILKQALSYFNFPYVGVIGSESKSKVLKKELRESGLPEEKISQLHCPIGAPFGNNTPFEIALSIVAQLLTQRDQIFKK